AVLWQPPPSNHVKCNLDAALFVTEQMVGMRVCLRDETNTFISAMTAKKDVVMSASEAEAWSLHQGLRWVANMGN
ncbi:LCR-like protein, partial [Trifolium pratense]